LKLREFPKVARSLPLSTRLIGWVHGLYYLHGIGSAVSVAVVAAMIATGTHVRLTAPATVSAFATGVAFLISDLYRQRFYLNVADEWGVHWRAALLRFVKWPWVLIAAADAITKRRLPYTITSKMRARGRTLGASIPHIGASALLVSAWLWRNAHGHSESNLLDGFLVVYLLYTTFVMITELLPQAAPYSRDLSATRIPR
jgi:hypothetical protein